jgi:ribosomal protein S18 acetylase RimI-like enzyme
LLHDDVLGATREKIDTVAMIKYEKAFNIISRDENAAIIVVIQGGKVVAMAQLNFITHLTFQGGKRAQIEGVRVAKNVRGQGIGKLLIQHIIELSVEQGCHLTQLTTNKQRPEAISFYEGLGFVATHEGMKLALG